MTNKTKRKLKWVPSLLIGGILINSASLKFAGFGPLKEHFTQLGLVNYLNLFGTMEFLFMVLFMYPRTMRLGFIMLTSYFAGAVAVELQYGSFLIGPLAIVSLVWLAAWLRNPGIFKEDQFQTDHYQIS